jgi:hypothetical protein
VISERRPGAEPSSGGSTLRPMRGGRGMVIPMGDIQLDDKFSFM